jgi:hypothetical protein
LTQEKATLFKAVILRHDCVHRNGFDKDGNELKVFTKAFVQNTADLICGEYRKGRAGTVVIQTLARHVPVVLNLVPMMSSRS